MCAEFERLVTGIDREKSVCTVVSEAGFELGGGGKEFVHAIPRGEGGSATLVFFRPDWDRLVSGGIPSEEIQGEFKKHGLSPDPRAHIHLMTLDPEFVCNFPSVSVWCHEETWYGLIFRHRGNDLASPKYALLVRQPRKWLNKDYWFCGVR